ncbi:DoxX family protein [Nocardia sp. NPDC005978]|uniref:DoxX family protein n=1 Tax=Nocardia sp. NPDC005978 TaxID=3156725 RepID=UPI0033A7FF3B
MTEKPNEPSTGAPGGETPATAPRPVGEPVRSPYDSAPTEQFTTSGSLPAFSKDQPAKDLPRTDEDLGLDPEVPVYSAVREEITASSGASPANAAAASEPAAVDAAAPTYAFASIPPAPPGPGESNGRLRRRGDDRRGTLDLGLLLLRLMIGGTFIYHGLQKLTGWFNGPGLEGTRDMMESGGWKHADIAASLLMVGELGGGILIVLGLATPLAAGAVLAVILDAWMWKQGMIPGVQYNAGTKSGVEIDSILAGAAAALILTGPGRLSLDRNRGWATRPFLGSLAALVAAIAAAIATYIYLHGGNPLTGIGPFA